MRKNNHEENVYCLAPSKHRHSISISNSSDLLMSFCIRISVNDDEARNLYSKAKNQGAIKLLDAYKNKVSSKEFNIPNSAKFFTKLQIEDEKIMDKLMSIKNPGRLHRMYDALFTKKMPARKAIEAEEAAPSMLP